ncbi:MAG: glutathione S-transferase family protein [Alphaproteobacteria bacterium]|nr:glutathione S-transferase family protein [Alphaproteobacteria bacterium]
MKLYTTAVAPNPRRVTIFLAEKGIDIPTVELDLGKSENLAPDFVAKNPMGRVPVLEMDDGSYLAESIAICRYFEEIQPEPPLFGVDARDKADVEMWNRRMESEVLGMVSGCFRHTHPYWADKIPQAPEYGEICRATLLERMEWLNSELADREFIAGDRFTVADITAHTGFTLARIPKIRIGEDQKNLQRWYDGVAARPSVSG